MKTAPPTHIHKRVHAQKKGKKKGLLCLPQRGCWLIIGNCVFCFLCVSVQPTDKGISGSSRIWIPLSSPSGAVKERRDAATPRWPFRAPLVAFRNWKLILGSPLSDRISPPPAAQRHHGRINPARQQMAGSERVCLFFRSWNWAKVSHHLGINPTFGGY